MAKVNPAIIMDMIEKGLSLSEPHNTLDEHGMFAAQNISYVESMNEVAETNVKNALIYIEQKMKETSDVGETPKDEPVIAEPETFETSEESVEPAVSENVDVSEAQESGDAEDDSSLTKKSTKKQRKAKK